MEKNELKVEFPAIGENIGLARTIVTAFICVLDPTLTEVMDLKTAVSEAVSNAVIHGYPGDQSGKIFLYCCLEGRQVTISIRDQGVGIADVAQARTPMFTTRPEEERSGMGFTVMEMLCDQVQVSSRPGAGTEVVLVKDFDKTQAEECHG